MQKWLAAPILALLFAAACGDAPASRPDATPTTGVVDEDADGPGDGRADSSGAAASAVPYRLAAPDAVVRLPAELREISGLTVLENGNLGAVQDEAGTLFELDPATGAIVSRRDFQARGDFEGVERVGRDVWALEANGDLTHLRAAGRGFDVTRVETGLAGRNDTEGLAYDRAGNRLLIACKESPGQGLGDVRAVYAFSLATNTLSAAPVFTLDRARVDAEDPFKSSAIAVRPGTGEIYVLSSVRKAIAVLAPDGALQTVVELPDSLYAQPEGLAFTPDGTLFISNEGPDGPATLLRFDPTDR